MRVSTTITLVAVTTTMIKNKPSVNLPNVVSLPPAVPAIYDKLDRQRFSVNDAKKSCKKMNHITSKRFVKKQACEVGSKNRCHRTSRKAKTKPHEANELIDLKKEIEAGLEPLKTKAKMKLLTRMKERDNKYSIRFSDMDEYEQQCFDCFGYNRDDRSEYDSEECHLPEYDEDGFYQGYDINGYNAAGFNREGYDCEGFDRDGYDKEGYNDEGCDRWGYGRDGLYKLDDADFESVARMEKPDFKERAWHQHLYTFRD